MPVNSHADSRNNNTADVGTSSFKRFDMFQRLRLLRKANKEQTKQWPPGETDLLSQLRCRDVIEPFDGAIENDRVIEIREWEIRSEQQRSRPSKTDEQCALQLNAVDEGGGGRDGMSRRHNTLSI